MLPTCALLMNPCRLVLNDHGLSVFLDGKHRCLRPDRSLRVPWFARCTRHREGYPFRPHAVSEFFHLAYKLAVLINLELCAGQMMIGIVCIDLGELNIAANQLVGNFNFDNSAVPLSMFTDKVSSMTKPFRGFDLTNDIPSERNIPRRSCRPLQKR